MKNARVLLSCVGALFAHTLWGANNMVPCSHKLELPNGEVLMGSLLADEANQWVFRSETCGEIRVPKAGARLSVLEISSAEPAGQPPAWVRAQDAPAEEKTRPAEPKVATSGAEGGAKASVATGPVAATPATPAAQWRRILEAGFSYQSRGTLVSSTSTYARAEISRETGTGKASLEGRYIFGKQDAQRNTDKLDAAFKLREKFLSRVDFRNEFSYGFDYLKELSHQFEEIVGFNLIVFDTPRVRYSIGPGVAIQYAQPLLGDTGFKLLGDVSHALTWKLGDRVSLTHSASYLYKAQYWEDYRLRANTALTGKITEQVTVNLRYEYEFEAIRPVVSGRSDHRVFTTLGYVF